MKEVKNLQEISEVSRKLSALLSLQTVERKPENPKSVVLLLHGLDERGRRIYRKLLRYLPEDSYVVAPNAPFPLPRMKSDRMDFGYSWYFYDKFQQTYQVDQTLSLSLLHSLLKEINPGELPLTIIGFSQGGYLAPLLAYQEKTTRHIIGIGCEFRTRFFPHPPTFTLDAVHGEADAIIPPAMAKNEIELLKEKNITVHWHPVPGVKHEVSSEMGQTIKKILEQYGEGSL